LTFEFLFANYATEVIGVAFVGNFKFCCVFV